MGIRDDLANLIGSLTSSDVEDQTSILGGSIDTVLTLVFFGVIIFVLFFVVRGIKHIMSYAGDGDELGSFKIHFMGKSTVKGNLNIHEYITESELDMLEGMAEVEIRDNTKSYRERVEKKKLFLYDFRITDYDEAWDLKGGRDSIIVTSVPLESEKYSWLDDKGDRSIVSPTFRQKSKNVFAHISSEYHPDYVDPFGKLKDIYELVIIPKDISVDMVDSKFGYKTKIELTKLQDGKADVIKTEHLKTISESYKKIKPSEDETNRLRDLIVVKDKEISDLHRDVEDYRHLAYPEPVIGERPKKNPFSKQSILGIVMMAVFMGGIGYGLPELVPSLKGIIEPLIGVGIMAGLMFLVVSLYYERKPQKEKDELGV